MSNFRRSNQIADVKTNDTERKVREFSECDDTIAHVRSDAEFGSDDIWRPECARRVASIKTILLSLVGFTSLD